MTKKLYVSGLAPNTLEETLQTLFSQVGTVVTTSVITDHDTGLGNGFGFVEMNTDSEGYHAISLLDGTIFEGGTINVKEVPLQIVHNARMDSRGGYNRY
jgi:RNA recognition motif-containing protein